MPDGLLVDTNVIIDFTRGRSDAVDFFSGLREPFSISAITVVELYAGIRGKSERRLLDRFVSTTEVLSVDAAHDVDCRVVPIEEARGRHESDGVFGLVNTGFHALVREIVRRINAGTRSGTI